MTYRKNQIEEWAHHLAHKLNDLAEQVDHYEFMDYIESCGGSREDADIATAEDLLRESTQAELVGWLEQIIEDSREIKDWDTVATAAGLRQAVSDFSSAEVEPDSLTTEEIMEQAREFIRLPGALQIMTAYRDLPEEVKDQVHSMIDWLGM